MTTAQSQHYHPSALLVLGSVSVYIAVGIAAGAVASRLAYKHARHRNATNAKTWGWWTVAAWPFVGVGLLLVGFGYGLYRILNRVVIPEEAR